MTIPLGADRAVFDNALAAAGEIGKTKMPAGLNADLDATLRGWVDEAWDTVTFALTKAFQFGKQQAQAAIDKSIAKVNELLAQAGKRASELHAILIKKLQEFIRAFLQGVLSLFPESMQLGALNFPLAGVSCTHSIKVGGSFGANLLALAEVVSEGEIALTFSYGSGAAH